MMIHIDPICCILKCQNNGDFNTTTLANFCLTIGLSSSSTSSCINILYLAGLMVMDLGWKGCKFETQRIIIDRHLICHINLQKTRLTISTINSNEAIWQSKLKIKTTISTVQSFCFKNCVLSSFFQYNDKYSKNLIINGWSMHGKQGLESGIAAL